jgi:hypothetical protein
MCALWSASPSLEESFIVSRILPAGIEPVGLFLGTDRFLAPAFLLLSAHLTVANGAFSPKFVQPSGKILYKSRAKLGEKRK